MIGIDSTDPFNFQPCNRLLVSNDGKSLQQCVGQNGLFRCLRHLNQVFIPLFFGTKLNGILQLNERNPAVGLCIFFSQVTQLLPQLFRRLIQHIHQCIQFYRISHRKKNGFYNRCTLIQFHYATSFARILISPKASACSISISPSFISSRTTRKVTIISVLECCLSSS